MCPKQRPNEEGKVLDSIGVRGLVALDLVERRTRYLARLYSLLAVRGDIFPRGRVVVEAVVFLDAARGEGGVGEEEVEDDVVAGVGGCGLQGIGAGADAERGEDVGPGSVHLISERGLGPGGFGIALHCGRLLTVSETPQENG